MLGSVLSGAGLAAGPAVAGFANVWPLALVFAGLGVVATGWSLRTSVVTGSVAGVLVAMYVIDLVGRLDPGLSGVRYVSVFKYYGNAIEDGIDPLAFCGVTVAALRCSPRSAPGCSIAATSRSDRAGSDQEGPLRLEVEDLGCDVVLGVDAADERPHAPVSEALRSIHGKLSSRERAGRTCGCRAASGARRARPCSSPPG